MVRLAFQQRHHAGAADALAAGRVDDDAFARQDIDDGNAHRDLHHLARAGQLDLEGAISTTAIAAGRSGRRCLEVLQVDRFFAAPQGRATHHGIHERRRAAGIDVCLLAARLQAGRQVVCHLGRHDRIVEAYMRGERGILQQVGKGRVFAGTHEVVQREALLLRPQAIGHGQQRGDADAGAEEQVFGRRRIQCKEIARRADFQLHAGTHGLVQGGRAAARGGFALDRDGIAATVVQRAAQRVLAHDAGRSGDVDVGARLIRRQRGAIGAYQAEGTDVAGFVGECVYDQFHGGQYSVAMVQMRSGWCLQQEAQGVQAIHRVDQADYLLLDLRSLCGKTQAVRHVGHEHRVLLALVAHQHLGRVDFHQILRQMYRHEARDRAHGGGRIHRRHRMTRGQAFDADLAHVGIVVGVVQRGGEIGGLLVDRHDVVAIVAPQGLPGGVVLAVQQFGLFPDEGDGPGHLIGDALQGVLLVHADHFSIIFFHMAQASRMPVSSVECDTLSPLSSTHSRFRPRLTRIGTLRPACEPVCTRSQASASSGLPKPNGPWKCSWMRRRSRLAISGPPSMPSATWRIWVSPTDTGCSTRKKDIDMATLGNRFRLKPAPCSERTMRRTCSGGMVLESSSMTWEKRSCSCSLPSSTSRSTCSGTMIMTLWPLPSERVMDWSSVMKESISEVSASTEDRKVLCTTGKWQPSVVFSSWIFQLPLKLNLCSPCTLMGKPAPCFMKRSIHFLAWPRKSDSGSTSWLKEAKIMPWQLSTRRLCSGRSAFSTTSSQPSGQGRPRSLPSRPYDQLWQGQVKPVALPLCFSQTVAPRWRQRFSSTLILPLLSRTRMTGWRPIWAVLKSPGFLISLSWPTQIQVLQKILSISTSKRAGSVQSEGSTIASCTRSAQDDSVLRGWKRSGAFIAFSSGLLSLSVWFRGGRRGCCLACVQRAVFSACSRCRPSAHRRSSSPLRPTSCRPALSGLPAMGTGMLSAGWPDRLKGRTSEESVSTEAPWRMASSVGGSDGKVGSSSASASASAASTSALKAARTSSAWATAASVVPAAAARRFSISAPSVPRPSRWPKAAWVSRLMRVMPASKAACMWAAVQGLPRQPLAAKAACTAAAMSASACTVTSFKRAVAADERAAATSKSAAMLPMALMTRSMLRAKGPTQSSELYCGQAPARLTRPNVGLKPTTPQQAAGRRIEPPVSLPMDRSTRLAPTAEAEPLEDPPVMRAGSCGFTAVPFQSLMPVMPQASSCMLARAVICQPSCSSLVTTSAWATAGGASASAALPPQVGWPAMSMQSLMATVGPLPPRWKRESRALPVPGTVRLLILQLPGRQCGLACAGHRWRRRRCACAGLASPWRVAGSVAGRGWAQVSWGIRLKVAWLAEGPIRAPDAGDLLGCFLDRFQAFQKSHQNRSN
eukprot:TRINITY_DN427_c1_g3_i1.p1 TRINITY_DN427_c1_g3~~TRINITY_DN427_c1_g3_i1.p1  ORF type:complete len:1404 (-),score=404.80 TRINITY_DN427_c1_g3_i1:6090-10301(-)